MADSVPRLELRIAAHADDPFLLDMAREACALEGRHPLPPADDPAVLALVPGHGDEAVIAAADGVLLGAAWWLIRDPPLLADATGGPLPELAMAVVQEHRRRGVGAALIEALAERAAGRYTALALNVHLLNPAVRLYVRAGFQVAAAGRGTLGVAMIRPLAPPGA